MAGPWEKYGAEVSGPWTKYGGERTPAGQGARDYGIDFSAPDESIRSAIAALPETEKNHAQDLWADERVRKLYAGTGFTPTPELSYGIPLIGPFLDEAAAGVIGGSHYLSHGRIGRPYDEALAEVRAKERAAVAAHPIENAVGKLGAGIATGGPIFGRLAPATTVLGRVGQGAVIGAPIGFAEGFGEGEGSLENRIKTGTQGAELGAAAGALIPVGTTLASRAAGVAAEHLSPTITRLRHGPGQAADEIIVRQIAREGSSPAQKRLDLQQGQNSARMGANSQAELPETLADTSDAMQRLTGSVYRAGGEAGNYVKQALESRQRGPANPYAPQPGEPTGQRARIMDTTERALQIRSSGSALQTERRILRDQAQEGKRLYGQAFNTQQPFDIQPVLDGFAILSQQYPAPFQARMLRALNLFRDNSPTRMPVNKLERFDAAKKSLDDMIEAAQRQGQNNLVRELTGFKSNLLQQVHANGANQWYADARNAWGSAAENREAIELGRSALRDGSELSVEHYRALTPGQQHLFRIGFLESMRNALGSRRPGNDVTQFMQQARVQELMNEIIPRSHGNGTFSNRTERFGEAMRREERMVQTRNVALGNSATAQRQSDDLAFSGHTLASMWDRFRSSPSLFNMGIEAVGSGINKVFGYRQDVALALAQRLLESDPTQRNRLLQRLARRGGPDRLARFADALDRSGNALIGATAGPLQIEKEGGK